MSRRTMIHIMKAQSMVSSVLYYLMAGLFVNFIYDKFIDWSGAEQRFNLKERLVVGLLWPLALILFIFHFRKQLLNNE